MKHIALIFLLLISIPCYSQKNLIDISGKVVSNSGSPVSECTVIISAENVYKVITDSKGTFNFSLLEDKYSFRIQKDGYIDSVYFAEIRKGVNDDLLFTIYPSAFLLDTVTVKPEKISPGISMQSWEISKQPAVFDDPARAVTTFSGPVNTNDQANNLSVYGTSPNYIQWNFEGAEIVSPNHLENAGTSNDRPAINGGGVSMVSSHLLESFNFQHSPFKAGTGNALSGMMDLKFREGNKKEFQGCVQVGALGVDLGFEGPIIKDKISFITNYRYSTIGLLSKIGVDFGDEKINYQDLSAAAIMDLKKGYIKIFGVLGNSFNHYEGKEDSMEVSEQKELNEINYKSGSAIAGVSYLTSTGSSTYLKITTIYSSKSVSRNEEPNFGFTNPEIKDILEQKKLSSSIIFTNKIERNKLLKVGTQFNYFTNSLGYTGSNGFEKNSMSEFLIQPFVLLDFDLNSNLEFNAGLHWYFLTHRKYASLQPRVEATYHLSAYSSLQIHAGSTAQMQPMQLYLYNKSNVNLEPSTIYATDLIYNHRWSSVLFSHKIFYQYGTEIPVNDSIEFSAFNYFNEYIPFTLTQDGNSKTYGYELNGRKNFGWLNVSGSVVFYRSLYSSAKGTFHESRYSTGYNSILNLGKNWNFIPKNGILSVNLRGQVRNGFRKYSEDNFNPGNHLPMFYRIDGRISWRRDRSRTTSIWSLDIQNLTNRKNVAYFYYDSVAGKELVKYQLGILPVLSYKIYF